MRRGGEQLPLRLSAGGLRPDSFQPALDRVNKGPFLSYHLDPRMNGGMNAAKAINRVALMHSSVIPTVPVTLEEMTEIDKEPTGVLVAPISECAAAATNADLPTPSSDFTDGAGQISPELMCDVHSVWLERTGKRGNGLVPSTLQGRVGACKGTWTVNPALSGRQLKCRPSQCKFEIWEPTDTQKVIEVCEMAQGKKPGRLDLQVLRMLEPRLANPKVLIRKLAEQLATDVIALSDLSAARRFCKHNGGAAILAKLQAGFQLEDELVQSSLRKLLRQRADDRFEERKFWIELPMSRRLMIIPDEFGLLAEDEVLLRIEGGDETRLNRAVLARNPW
eukprot:SAG31_NODE_2712_length_5208_cov_1.414563_5_plen_335_part_00